MMKRNRLGTTVIVFCDEPGCGRCWTYDSHLATFAAARRAATGVGWQCVRTAEARRDTCRFCVASPVAAR